MTLRDARHIRAVAEYIARNHEAGLQQVITVSAMGAETDELLDLVPLVSSAPAPRELDVLVTAGERKAMALFVLALREEGVPAVSLTGSQAGIITDGDHMQAHVVAVRPERVVQALEKGSVPVVGGAQGVSRAGEITFLGRGGTDTTAVALACALGAEKCELYTDVPGLFTADPRLVPEARLIERLSFDEMLAMCHAGCPKPAASSVELARRYGVPLRVRPAFTWEKGTWIGSCARATGPIAVLASADPTSADLTSADPTSADLTSGDPASANGADGSRGRARVSIVCDAIDADPSAVSRTIDALAAIGIAVEQLSASESALTVVIRREQMRSAVLALHREFLPTADGRPRAEAQLELLLTQQPEAEASGADRGNL